MSGLCLGNALQVAHLLPSSPDPDPRQQGRGVLSAHASAPQTGCSIIAGFLHYFFLACFFWMLVEAGMLFLMVRNLKVVNYFHSRNIKMPYLCAFGYGLPALVVVVAVSARPQGYGTHDR